MSDKIKKAGTIEEVAALADEDARADSLRTVKWAVASYIQQKRCVQRKLDFVRNRGEMYKAQLTGDYKAKLLRALSKLGELGVTCIRGQSTQKSWGAEIETSCRLDGREGSIYIWQKRWGPEVRVFVKTSVKKGEYNSDKLALVIGFGSKNMLVKNRSLDIAVGE